MNENILYSVSYNDMKKIIINYYAQQGRNVDLRISNEIDTDRFAGMVTTSIQMTEKSTIGGIESKSHCYLDIDDLKEIVGNVLEQDCTEMSMKWNKRYRDNVERMKSGNVFEVADIVRNLSFKQKDKGLSTTEKKMLINAKQILVSELMLAQSKQKEEIESIVDDKINYSYEIHMAEQNNSDSNNDENDGIVKKFIQT